jgi:hypothetical protein
MGRRSRETPCDAYGENLVKATLPGGGWMYHHDGINLQLHKIFRQSGMVSDMEVEMSGDVARQDSSLLGAYLTFW